jgi:hypothetical protein
MAARAENLTRVRVLLRVDAMVEDQTTNELVVSEPLTWLEICVRYPEEWVALVEIDWVNENDLDFRSARVAGHGKTRREPLQHAEPLWARYEEIGHFFTGRVRAPFRSFHML